MSVEAIERDFKKKVCAKIRIASEGMERYRIFTPFLFEDGDHLAIVMKKQAKEWVLSDEGHTYMHLSYDIDEKDLHKGTRQKVISNALSAFNVEDRDGELLFSIKDARYGDALYSFSQALLKINDVSYLSRERVRSAFMEDFKELIRENIPTERYSFDWKDDQRDPQGSYTVDCRVNGMARPIFIYALPNDDHTRDATIALLQFERWGLPHRSIAIFEEQEEINRKVLARFSDVCEKQFSSMSANRVRIANYLKEQIA